MRFNLNTSSLKRTLTFTRDSVCLFLFFIVLVCGRGRCCDGYSRSVP